MAICQVCKRDMLTASSCSVSALHIDERPFPVVPYGRERRHGSVPTVVQCCHDCGVEPGGFHHLGCDWAECPRCRGQLITCTCPFDEFHVDTDEDADWLEDGM